MNDLESLNHLSQLPNWMIYSLAILIVIVPFIMEIIRQNKQKKMQENYDSIIMGIATSQDSLYKNFNILLDVLYEKYANNLNLELTHHVIDLVYNRTKQCIINRIQDHIHDKSRYRNGVLIRELIQEDITFLISNKYHQDIMLLNKLTFKGYKLSEHLINEIDYKEVIDKILQIVLTETDINSPFTMCTHFKKDIDSYFSMLTNKGKNYFENLNVEWNK